MKNQRGQNCSKCGRWVAAGEGELNRWFDDEEDKMVWLVYHSDTAICEANIAEDRAKQARRIERQKREGAFFRLFDKAEYPEGPIDIADVASETLLDDMNIYGGGKMVTLDSQGFIWLIWNNGMDGDDWSRNNIRTWGAGAVGRRLPVTDELVAEARWIAAEIAAMKVV